MNLYCLEVPANSARLISLAELSNCISISANLHAALANLFVTCFETNNLGIYLPSTIYFLTLNNTLASVAMITPHEAYNKYMIYNACTGAAFRRRGLMSKLIQQILADFIGQNVYLQVKKHNLTAYNLYVKLGFSPVHITKEIITMQY